MRYTHIIAIATAITTLIAMGSCQKQPQEPQSHLSQVEIAPTALLNSAQIEIDPQANSNTKAIADPTKVMALTFLRADEAPSHTYPKFAPLAATRAAGAGRQPVTFTAKQYFQLNDRRTRMIGLYPNTHTAKDTCMEWPMANGQIDVMTTHMQSGAITLPMPNFEFNHQTSQIQFYPYTETSSAQTQCGQITKIEIVDQPANCRFNFTDTTAQKTGAIAFDAIADQTYVGQNLVAAQLPITKDNASMACDPMMIQTHDKKYTLKIRITSSTLGVLTAELTQKFVKGESYKIYLKIDIRQITPQAYITHWVTKDVNADTPPANENGFVVGLYNGAMVADPTLNMIILDRRGSTTNGRNAGATTDVDPKLAWGVPIADPDGQSFAIYKSGWDNTFNPKVTTTHQAIMYCRGKNGNPAITPSKNEGWHLPSNREMLMIWVAAPAMPGYMASNGAITSNGGQYGFDGTSAYYTSVGDTITQLNAYSINTTGDNIGSIGLTPQATALSVRCIKSVPVPEMLKPTKPQVASDDDGVIINAVSMLPRAALYDNGLSVPTATAPAYSNHTSVTNRVARQFIVAWADASASSVPNSGGVGAAPCPEGWRIPNMRELQLMSALSGNIEMEYKKAGQTNTLAPGKYWSSTQGIGAAAAKVWAVSVTTGQAECLPATDKLPVRCVKSI